MVTVETAPVRRKHRSRTRFWTSWALVLGGASLGMMSASLSVEHRGFFVGAGTAFWLMGIALQLTYAPRFFAMLRHR